MLIRLFPPPTVLQTPDVPTPRAAYIYLFVCLFICLFALSRGRGLTGRVPRTPLCGWAAGRRSSPRWRRPRAGAAAPRRPGFPSRRRRTGRSLRCSPGRSRRRLEGDTARMRPGGSGEGLRRVVERSPFWMRASRASVWPCSAAMARGVTPWPSRESTLAPCRRRSIRTSTRPAWTAGRKLDAKNKQKQGRGSLTSGSVTFAASCVAVHLVRHTCSTKAPPTTRV